MLIWALKILKPFRVNMAAQFGIQLNLPEANRLINIYVYVKIRRIPSNKTAETGTNFYPLL